MRHKPSVRLRPLLMALLWALPPHARAAEIGHQVGRMAPSLALPDIYGEQVKLSRYRGKKHVLLIFFLEGVTQRCTVELVAFGKKARDYRKLDTEIVGVTPYDSGEQKTFCDASEFPYPMLTDKEQKALRLFGLLGAAAAQQAPRRAYFLIDKQGRILLRRESNSPMKNKDLLELIKKLT